MVSNKGKEGQWSRLRVNERSCEQNGKITEGEHKILFWREKHYSLREMWRGGCTGNISTGLVQQFLAQMLHFHVMHQFSVGCISTARHAAIIKGSTGLTVWGHRVNNMDDISFYTDSQISHTHRSSLGADSR